MPAPRRPFHLLLMSLAVSSLGDWLYNVAPLAFVYGRPGSPGGVAATRVAGVTPMLVLGPFGGARADRHDRRRLLIASDLGRALLMAALAGVAAGGVPIVLAPLPAALPTAPGTVYPPAGAASTARRGPGSGPTRGGAARWAPGPRAVV